MKKPIIILLASLAPFFAHAQLPTPAIVAPVPPPVWLDSNSQPNAKALAALALVADAGSDGLNPEAYHLTELQGLAHPQSQADAAGFEQQLSEGFAAYLHDEAVGRIPVGTSRDATFTADFDYGAAMQAVAGISSPEDLAHYVDELKPAEPDYAMLRQTLAALRDQQQKGQGWQPIPDGPALKPGMRSPVVPQVRVRLGPPPVDGKDATLFDDALSGALKAFQETHAIKDDGHLGKDTRAALNMPIEGRIAEVIAAMERWRWLPHDLTQRYVFDNVGGYWTRYVDGGKPQFQLPIIVGREERETPLLISTIVDVVLNPSWTVPPTIIKKDVLPGLHKDPAYLEKKHLKLYRRTDEGLEEVSAADYHGGSEYVLRQPPGEENPLGQYKLQFPNVYSIYMHDTDEKKKFDAALRNFSSGCIRVENVRQLVSTLLAGQLTDDQINDFVAKQDTKTIRLTNPLPVYITYLSVWSDLDGHVIFGPDQYGKDVDLAAKVDAP